MPTVRVHSASYVNWVGRTVVQVRVKKKLLYRSLEKRIDALSVEDMSPREVWNKLRTFPSKDKHAAGRVALTPVPPTPTRDGGSATSSHSAQYSIRFLLFTLALADPALPAHFCLSGFAFTKRPIRL